MVRDSIYNKLQSALNLFNLQEICDIAIHKFRKISWAQLQDRIIRNKYTLTKKNVIQILIEMVKENKTSSDELEELISALLLIGTVKSKKRNWVTYYVKDKSDYNIALEDIFNSIRGSIRRQGILADITTELVDSRHVLSITKKNVLKSKGVKKLAPIFIQFYAGYPYFFCSRKLVGKILLSVVEGLGYTRCKSCSLSGKNVFELFRMLQNMHENVSSCTMLLASSTFEPTLRKHEHGVDFGQRAERAKYVDQLYGTSPPQLETLSVTIKDAVWQTNAHGMQGEPMQDVKLTLRAPNTIELLKQLITEGIVTTPIPPYMQAIINSGKNELKLVQNITSNTENE